MDITSYLLGKNSAGGGGGGGSDLDWTALGYDSTPQAIIDAYNIALNIKETWTSTSILSRNYKNVIICPLVDTSSQTSWNYFANNCCSLLQMPLLDTSNVTNMANSFYACSALRHIPKFNTSKVTSFTNTFQGCSNLTNESINNILEMCISATVYTGTKTLYQLGFRSSIHSAAKIQALPNYQAFIDAGWTIGY